MAVDGGATFSAPQTHMGRGGRRCALGRVCLGGVWQHWGCDGDGWVGMTGERAPRESELERKSAGRRESRRPTEAEVLEELRRSRGEGMERPSEAEPPPPHYGRGGS